jgi:hypothetical protein
MPPRSPPRRSTRLGPGSRTRTSSAAAGSSTTQASRPSSLGGGGRILLVTGSLLGPCDNLLGDHYLLKTTNNKIDYCRLHGIEIVHNLVHLDTELAGY